jgi:hypothetical protein
LSPREARDEKRAPRSPHFGSWCVGWPTCSEIAATTDVPPRVTSAEPDVLSVDASIRACRAHDGPRPSARGDHFAIASKGY